MNNNDDPVILQGRLVIDEDQSGPDFAGHFDTLDFPGGVVVRLSSRPHLPPFDFQWYNANPESPDVPISIKHSAVIKYADHGRFYNSRIISYTSDSMLARFDFGKELICGTLSLTVDITWRKPNGSIYTNSKTELYGVLADNPQKAEIKALLPNLDTQVLCYMESRFRQFNNKGLPLWGPPNGFGTMQLDKPPATREQVFSWRENIKGGIALYEVKKREVARHFANERIANPDAPELTEDQMRMALYQYYNGGFYWIYNKDAKQWDRDPRGSGYADRFLTIKRAVEAGRFPPEWN